MASESYEIRTADGKLFCKCLNNDGEVRLVGKNCSMSMQEFVLKVHDPAYRSRGKRRRPQEMKGSIPF